MNYKFIAISSVVHHFSYKDNTQLLESKPKEPIFWGSNLLSYFEITKVYYNYFLSLYFKFWSQ